MSLAFPNNPTLNQTYQSGSSSTYIWNGSYWVVSAPALSNIAVQTASYSERVANIQANPPTTGTGSFWYDIDTGNSYIKYDTSWVPVQSNTVNATSASFVPGGTVPNWISAGTIQAVGINATSSAGLAPPTLPTTTVRNNISYKQIGPKTYQVMGILDYTSNTGAAAGTGDYIYTLPAGLQFDTTIASQTIYQGGIGANDQNLVRKLLPSSFTQVTDGSTVTIPASIVIWDATRYRIYFWTYGSANSYRCQGSGWYAVNNSTMGINWTFTFQTP